MNDLCKAVLTNRITVGGIQDVLDRYYKYGIGCNGTTKLRLIRTLTDILWWAKKKFVTELYGVIDTLDDGDISVGNDFSDIIKRRYLIDRVSRHMKIEPWMEEAFFQALALEYSIGFLDISVIDNIVIGCDPEWICYGIDASFESLNPTIDENFDTSDESMRSIFRRISLDSRLSGSHSREINLKLDEVAKTKKVAQSINEMEYDTIILGNLIISEEECGVGNGYPYNEAILSKNKKDYTTAHILQEGLLEEEHRAIKRCKRKKSHNIKPRHLSDDKLWELCQKDGPIIVEDLGLSSSDEATYFTEGIRNITGRLFRRRRKK